MSSSPADSPQTRADWPVKRHQPPRVSRVGQTLGGHYLLERKIGEGAMAEVYEVTHCRLERRMALKIMHPDLAADQRLVDRFEREAKTLGKLYSENIVGVSDFGQAEDGSPFLVMELLDGRDLRKVLTDQRNLPVGQAVALVLDACRGIQAAHARGIVHRDLKPENLFVVRQEDGTQRCKVVDFGVVKITDAATFTRQGSLIGTVRYMAPEQARGERDIDGRADVFALGAILSECLSGVPAFPGRSHREVLEEVMRGEPRPLDSTLGIPARLEAIVRRALAGDRDKRFASAHDLGAALRRFQSALPEAPPSSPPQLPMPVVSSAQTRIATEPEFDSFDGSQPPLEGSAAGGRPHRRPPAYRWIAAGCLAVLAAALAGWWLLTPGQRAGANAPGSPLQPSAADRAP